MTTEAVELVKRIYDAWDRKESARDFISDEVEYVNPSYAVEPGIRRGRSARPLRVVPVLSGGARGGGASGVIRAPDRVSAGWDPGTVPPDLPIGSLSAGRRGDWRLRTARCSFAELTGRAAV
jgi:hypothetical protein